MLNNHESFMIDFSTFKKQICTNVAVKYVNTKNSISSV